MKIWQKGVLFENEKQIIKLIKSNKQEDFLFFKMIII